MKIAIIEDEPTHAQLISRCVQKWGKQRKQPLTVFTFQTAEAFLFQWEEAVFDLLFIDIQMPGMNGMDMARKIREKDQETGLIFTTGITDYIAEGYEVSAMHYLVKPVQEGQVYACLDRFAEKKKPGACLVLHTVSEEVLKIPVKTINYVEAMGHRCIVKAAYQDPVEVKEGLLELEKMLCAHGKEGFMKCHRSYLCGIGNICRIDRESIYFDDGSHIPVSRRMYQKANQAFISYFRNCM